MQDPGGGQALSGHPGVAAPGSDPGGGDSNLDHRNREVREQVPHGGSDAEAGHLIINPNSSAKERSGAIMQDMPEGAIIVNNAGGGGGWGDPYEREPQKVLWDVQNDYISRESARQNYGVVIHENNRTVDEDATARLRRSREDN